MDQPLHWNEAFALGHPELDADHRSLIQAINAICSIYETGAEPKHLRQLLGDLRRSVKEHFDRENRLLHEIVARPHKHLRPAQAISIAVLNDHIEVHRRTLAQLRCIVRATQPMRGRSSEAKELSEELVAWFLEHAIKHDAHLKAVFQAM